MKNILTISILFISSVFASAQSVFDFSLKEVKSGEVVSLKDYKSKQGTVIIFMSTKCPYAKYYEQRIQKMSNEYQSKGVNFLMINSFNSESIDRMKSQANNLGTAYLHDESKDIANFLGAKKSPEVFLLKNSGDIYYSGAIDDNPQVANDVKTHYLREAIDALLNNKPIKSIDSRPVGCMIK